MAMCPRRAARNSRMTTDSEAPAEFMFYLPKYKAFFQPLDFRPPFVLPPGAAPQVAYVWKTEEKGSDVNLGVHLVRDAALRIFDEAAVLTSDTDLVEPIRIVTQEFGLPVTLLTPCEESPKLR